MCTEIFVCGISLTSGQLVSELFPEIVRITHKSGSPLKFNFEIPHGRFSIQ